MGLSEDDGWDDTGYREPRPRGIASRIVTSVLFMAFMVFLGVRSALHDVWIGVAGATIAFLAMAFVMTRGLVRLHRRMSFPGSTSEDQ